MSDASRIRFDPFEALGLEPRFDLEAASIDAAWMRRLRAAHPDRAGGGAEHSEIARSAATLNEARAILRDPLRRGAALPPSFLPEMLELRERLEEAIDAGEEAGLLELAEEIDGRRSSVLTRLATLFAEPRAAPISNATRLELNVLRYLDRVREELRQAPRERS